MLVKKMLALFIVVVAFYVNAGNFIGEDDNGRQWSCSLEEEFGSQYAVVSFDSTGSSLAKIKIAFPSRVKTDYYSTTPKWYSVGRVYAQSNTNLCEVVIPSTVTKLGTWAFSHNKSLTNVVFSGNSSLQRLCGGAFAECPALTKITLPSSLKTIDDGVFKNCVSLRKLVIPDSVGKIDNNSLGILQGCTGLECLTLGSGITNMNGTIGYPLISLTSVVWKKSPLSYVPSYFFQGCAKLEKIAFPDSICSLGSQSLYDCSSLKTVTLPDTVTNIGSYAFARCTNLCEFRFPPNLQKLGERAFFCDHHLSRVVFTGDLPNCSSDIYENTGSLSTTPLITYVQKDRSGWDEFVAAGKWCGKDIRYRSYVIGFDGNGAASGTMDEQVVYYGESTALPANKYVNVGYALAGWATTPSGPVVYKDGQEVLNLVEEIDGRIVLYAVWEPMEDPVITPGDGATFDTDECVVTLSSGNDDARLYFSTNGTTPRTTGAFEYTGPFVISNTSTIKVVAVKGNSKSNYVTATITKVDPVPPDAPVISPADGYSFIDDTCRVEISCATDGVEIYFTTNGTTPRAIDANRYTGPFDIDCTTTIKAVSVRNKLKSSYVTAVITKRTLTISDALEAGDRVFTCSEPSPWTAIADATAVSGGSSARSGSIGLSSESWIETTVSGPGTLVFWWKVDCEWDDSGAKTWDHLKYEIDGVEQDRIDGFSDWGKVTCAFADAAPHTIRWTYVKDDYDEDGLSYADCGWIDGVTWTAPASAIPEIDAQATPAQVNAALEGSKDAGLQEHITDAATYNAYREWASGVKTSDGTSAAGHEAVKDSSYSWLSFALRTEKLLDAAPSEVKVESFEPASEPDKFAFVIRVKDVDVGSDAVAEQLKDVFGLEGGTTLGSGGLSSENVNITFDTPENGKVKFTAGPKDSNAGTFFMKVKMK